MELGDWTATREAVQKITPIHLLVNNAGTFVLESFLDAAPEHFDHMFNVNVNNERVPGCGGRSGSGN